MADVSVSVWLRRVPADELERHLRVGGAEATDDLPSFLIDTVECDLLAGLVRLPSPECVPSDLDLDWLGAEPRGDQWVIAPERIGPLRIRLRLLHQWVSDHLDPEMLTKLAAPGIPEAENPATAAGLPSQLGDCLNDYERFLGDAAAVEEAVIARIG